VKKKQDGESRPVFYSEKERRRHMPAALLAEMERFELSRAVTRLPHFESESLSRL